MPIPVICPSCKKRFQVSEKFAGQTGPCPQCKKPIRVPKLEEQVQIHAPEDAPVGAAKSAAAQAAAALKPIARKETKLKPVAIAAGACGALAILVVAWVAGQQIQELPALRVVGLLLISPPIAAAGYMFLRNDELEPYRGPALWIRAAICAAVYILLWVGYYFIPSEITGEPYYWFFLPIPFVILGALAPFATLDLEFGNGFFHYAFYLGVTLVLGMLAGLHMPWQMG
jgi:hypothetical protein